MQCDLCFGGLRVSAGDMEGGINETGGGVERAEGEGNQEVICLRGHGRGMRGLGLLLLLSGSKS